MQAQIRSDVWSKRCSKNILIFILFQAFAGILQCPAAALCCLSASVPWIFRGPRPASKFAGAGAAIHTVSEKEQKDELAAESLVGGRICRWQARLSMTRVHNSISTLFIYLFFSTLYCQGQAPRLERLLTGEEQA